MGQATLNPHEETAARAQRGARMVAVGVALNVVLAMVKIGGGVLGHAYALVADGVESLCDLAVSVLMWAGFQWAAQPPDDNHPYGHGKAEPVSGLLTAVMIIGASLGIGWHALVEVMAPGRTPSWWTLPILAFGVVAKALFAGRVAKAGRDTSSTALGVEAWHQVSDAITSAAAFIGISIALLGGPRFAAADGWAAMVASIVIGLNGLKVFVRALGEVMDIAVPAEMEQQVRDLASQVPGVLSLHRCRIRKSGFSHLVDIQIRVHGDLSVRDGHTIAHRVKDALLSSGLRVSDVTVHVEPQ